MGSLMRGWTRRAFLSSAAAGSLARAESAKGAVLPAEWKRFPDPTTEFEIFRLTDPAHSSFLPAYYGRALSRRNVFMLFSSDRAGSLQAFRMDLKTGQSRQLTSAEELDAASLNLMPDERSFCYLDGASLRVMGLAALHDRELYRVPDGWKRTAGASVSSDGLRATFAEAKESACRLRQVTLARGAAETVVETSWTITDPILNPRRAQILYRQGDEALWLVNADGHQNRKLKLAEGRIGPARWSPDGRTVLYLHFPDNPAELHAIREHTPDQNLDKLVAKTSQFAHFGCNANASVFVGASQNKASPTILLLLRVTRREFTLCEHHASNLSTVAPIFSPDSQRVYFQSDRDGKPAIYMVHVEKLVEKTGAET